MIIALATGSGRCGTQTFGAQMQRLKGVIGVHEGCQVVNLQRRNSWPQYAPHLVCGSDKAREWNLAALRTRRAWAYNQHEAGGMVAYGEGAHYLGLNLPLVEQVFPEARIVHLVRDPVQMVWSMMNHAGPKIYARGSHERTPGGRWRWWGDSFPNWPGSTTRASGYAWYWQHTNEAIERTTLPRLLVRTEELRLAETWARILGFIGLDMKVDAPGLVFNARHPKRRPSVPPDVASTIVKICTWKPR